MRPSRVLTAALTALLALSACTSGKKPDPNAAVARNRARLALLAQATADNSYDASYTFVQSPSNASGLIRIRQVPPQYRIDVISKSSGASFYALTTGTVSCSQKSFKKTCFLVARPGEEVPALFDPGVQRLFRDAVEDLAANPGDYLVNLTAPPSGSETPTATPTVTPSVTPSASGAVLLPIPAGECFAVTRASGAPPASEKGGFEDGTYCFSDQGVATYIAVASGTLTLTRLAADPPPKAAFKPSAKVVKLPDLTPTPTPKK